MGLLSNWLRKRRFRKAINTLKEYAGKDRDELVREGGWDLVAGTDWSWISNQWQNANSIWKNYSDSDLEVAYAAASAIHACIRLKCTTAAQAWFEIGTYAKNGWKGIEDHDFYRLIRRPNGVSELYDLRADPRELNNVHGKATYASVQDELERAMLDWYVHTADTVPFVQDERGFSEEVRTRVGDTG